MSMKSETVIVIIYLVAFSMAFPITSIDFFLRQIKICTIIHFSLVTYYKPQSKKTQYG